MKRKEDVLTEEAEITKGRHADGLSSPHQTLDAKNKRKLCDLQRYNLALRQIGPHFAVLIWRYCDRLGWN